MSPSIPTPPTRDAERLRRVTALVPGVSGRLRAVCAGLPPAEFDALVRRIAETTVKFEMMEETRLSPSP